MAEEIEVKSVAEAQEKLAEIAKDSSINKPTEAEIKQAEEVFNTAAKAFQDKVFDVGEEKDVASISNFLLEYLEKYVYWTKNGWMGVLKMYDEITEFKKKYKSGPYTVGYQALEFLFYTLTNPGGTGIKSARGIEKHTEVYGNLVESSGKALEEAREELKEIQFLQETWNAMLQGFYLEKQDGVEIEGEEQIVENDEAASENVDSDTKLEIVKD